MRVGAMQRDLLARDRQELVDFGQRIGRGLVEERQLVATRAPPAVAKQLYQGPSHVAAAHERLDIVERLVRLTAAHAQRVFVPMRRVVPAVIAQIQAAEEHQLLIDQRDLLVV
jgi:hypothetical protein